MGILRHTVVLDVCLVAPVRLLLHRQALQPVRHLALMVVAVHLLEVLLVMPTGHMADVAANMGKSCYFSLLRRSHVVLGMTGFDAMEMSPHERVMQISLRNDH